MNSFLDFESESRGEAVIFSCRGAFLLSTFERMDRLIAEVKAAPGWKIVLDLSGVRSMDSTGVGTLAVLLKHAMTAGRELVLVAGAEVRRVLAVASLDRAFRFAESVEAALGPG